MENRTLIRKLKAEQHQYIMKVDKLNTFMNNHPYPYNISRSQNDLLQLQKEAMVNLIMIIGARINDLVGDE